LIPGELQNIIESRDTVYVFEGSLLVNGGGPLNCDRLVYDGIIV